MKIVNIRVKALWRKILREQNCTDKEEEYYYIMYGWYKSKKTAIVPYSFFFLTFRRCIRSFSLSLKLRLHFE